VRRVRRLLQGSLAVVSRRLEAARSWRKTAVAMLREIILWPDPRLKEKALAVASVDAKTQRLIDDMFETMYAADGVGLAAPQLGVLSGSW